MVLVAGVFGGASVSLSLGPQKPFSQPLKISTFSSCSLFIISTVVFVIVYSVSCIHQQCSSSVYECETANLKIYHTSD